MKTSKYNQIKKKDNYDLLKLSGFFWELFPELTSDYDVDLKLMKQFEK